MRQTFISALIELAEKDEKIFLLTGDLGYNALEKFRERFPKRFINCGLTEQNIIGVAAGMSLCGKKPYVYSIIPFLTMRCFEQIRNDICYQNLDVRLIGIGEGLSYDTLGPTHHSIEDIAIMRALPNMAIICPGDPKETEAVLNTMKSYHGPVYFRLGKSKEPAVYLKTPSLKIGKGITIKKGSGITIIATGNMLYNAKEAGNQLAGRGIDVRLISLPFIKPIDKKIILKAAEETKAIFTTEEHSLIGGLGGAVAEILAESDSKVVFRRISLPDEFCKHVGKHDYLREKNHLSAGQIASRILKIIKNN